MAAEVERLQAHAVEQARQRLERLYDQTTPTAEVADLTLLIHVCAGDDLRRVS